MTILFNAAPAQVVAASGLEPALQVVVPLAITGMILTAVVVIVFIAVWGTESGHRADVLRAVAEIVRALGRAIQEIINAAGRLIERVLGPGTGGPPPAV